MRALSFLVLAGCLHTQPTPRARTVFDEGRAYARASNFSRALGMFMTLRAPQLADWVFPEAYAIEAEIYLRNCHYADALAVARDFRTHVLPVRARVLALVEGAPLRDDEPAWIASRVRGARTADERWDRIDRLLVELDIADTVLAHVEQAVVEERTLLVDVGLQTIDLITHADGKHHVWKFDGEWWPDELAHYRVPLRSRCERRH